MIGFVRIRCGWQAAHTRDLRGSHFTTAVKAVAIAVAAVLFAPSMASAATDADIKRLEKIILQQHKRIESQERRLRRLERRRPTSRRKAGFSSVIPTKGTTLLNAKDLSALRGGMLTTKGILVLLPDGNFYTVPFFMVDTSGMTAEVSPKAPIEVSPKTREDPKPKDPVPPKETKKEVKKSQEKKEPTGTGSGTQPRPPLPPSGEGARPKSEKAPEQLLVERNAIVLPPGTLQIEPGFEYTRFSNSRIAISGVSIFEAIIIGLIRVDSIERDIFRGQLITRLGIIKRLQADMTISYLYRNDLEILGVGTPDVMERTITGHGIGDIEFGLTGQPVIGNGAIPDILVRVNAILPTGENPFEIPTEIVAGTSETRLIRTPTGSGFYGVGATATFVWTSDPVVFFTGAGFQYNIPRRFDGFDGKINPGNSLQFFAGLNLAVSDKVSISLSFVHQRTLSSKVDGVTSPGTSFSDNRLSLGASIAVAKKTSVIVAASAGLGDQSPDFIFTIRIPLTFQLWK